MPYPDQENEFDREEYRDPEAQLGGADDVEKTTYVVGEGTSPNRRKGDGPSALVPARGGPGGLIAIVVALIVLGAIAYLISVIH